MSKQQQNFFSQTVLPWAVLFNFQIISATKAITVGTQETIGMRLQILQIANKITSVKKQESAQHSSVICLLCRQVQRWTVEKRNYARRKNTYKFKNKGVQNLF